MASWRELMKATQKRWLGFKERDGTLLQQELNYQPYPTEACPLCREVGGLCEGCIVYQLTGGPCLPVQANGITSLKDLSKYRVSLVCLNS